MEDILAYFPGTTRLEDFKEEVTNSLSAADRKISELRREMAGHAFAAERIRGDIKALRSRHVAFPTDASCSLSGLPLFSTANFYAFACGHAYLADFLVALLLPRLHAAQRARVGEVTEGLVRGRARLAALEGGGGGGKGGRASSRGRSSSGRSSSGSSSSGSGGGPEGGEGARAALATRLAALQSELDEVVAGECPLCGQYIISTISEPLESAEDASWDL